MTGKAQPRVSLRVPQQIFFLALMGLMASGAIAPPKRGMATIQGLFIRNPVMTGETQFLLLFSQQPRFIRFVRIMTCYAPPLGGGRMSNHAGRIIKAVMTVKTKNRVRFGQQRTLP
jgi:hypothetical protein